MKISTGWEQSIYILLILSRIPEGKTVSSVALSERLDASPSYLKKTIKSLVNEGLVKSTPGKGGGFSLAKPLNEINSYDVFVAIEGRGQVFASQHLLTKFLDMDQSKIKPCAVSSAMDGIEQSLISTLSDVHLDQMLDEIKAKYDLDDLDQWITSHS